MWSIGIYSGASALELTDSPKVVNPVLTRDSVTDVPASFLADPFMLKVDEIWYMFFEVMNRKTGKGEIGLAVSSDGLSWTYQQIVVAEDFHLSYPCVFEWQNDYYMIPETLEPGEVRLYRAETFPLKWSLVGPILDVRCADPSIFRFEDRWWMFACPSPYEHDTLRLYFADDLMGPWREHPASPIVEGDKGMARPAGRVLVSSSGVTRFAQDCKIRYGNSVKAFGILELTATNYAEKEHPGSPILQPSERGWNALGMHHIDAHPLPQGGWLASVDGLAEKE